jgi:hypothetical protein
LKWEKLNNDIKVIASELGADIKGVEITSSVSKTRKDIATIINRLRMIVLQKYFLKGRESFGYDKRKHIDMLRESVTKGDFYNAFPNNLDLAAALIEVSWWCCDESY